MGGSQVKIVGAFGTLAPVLAAAIARYGDRLPGMIKAEFDRREVAAGVKASASASSARRVFSRSPSLEEVRTIPIGSDYEVTNGIRSVTWRVLDHVVDSTTTRASRAG